MPSAVPPTDVSYFKGGTCSKVRFDAALSNGIPLCIEDTHTSLQGEWEPHAFVQRYGSLAVSPIDCLTGEEVRGIWDVHRFFEMLGRGDVLYGMLKLKVRCYLITVAVLTNRLGLAPGGIFRQTLCIPRPRF